MNGIVNPKLIVADLDGTMLHDADTFEGRFISDHTVEVLNRAHDAGYRFAVATARPVSTGYAYARKLPVDAFIYLNGALIDFDPSASDETLLTSGVTPSDGHLLRVGFSATRACEVCRQLLDALPGLKLGIVMNDIRYTNFDVSVYWKTQTWRWTDFTDVPEGTADKLIIFPTSEQWPILERLVPPDFAVSISEGTMWMLMNPLANKRHAMEVLCERMEVPVEATVSFGDDLIDIDMLTRSGIGVAVANANPKVLDIADQVCPSNDDDGPAQWMLDHLL